MAMLPLSQSDQPTPSARKGHGFALVASALTIAVVANCRRLAGWALLFVAVVALGVALVLATARP